MSEVQSNMFTHEEAMKQSTEYFGGNDLAAAAFVGKYALRDSYGNILEPTPDEMHRRLAREFARVEKKYPNPRTEEEIYQQLRMFTKIIPQGSPMAGIGNSYQRMSLSNCVHGEALVYTKEHGLVKMRDIVPGLHVLTHKGRFRKVLRHWSNGEKETYTVVRSFSKKPVSVRTEQEMGRFCAVTPDHRVYTSSGNWETVEELLGKRNKALSAPCIVPSDSQGTDLSVLSMGLGRTVLLDETLAWIFGLYFAEGAIKNYDTPSPSTYFTLAKGEMELAERISNWSEANLGHRAWIQTWDGLNFIQVNVFDKFFGSFILNNFGHGFNKKRIPEWVFALPPAIRKAFLDGFMMGDATNYESLDAGYNVFSIANSTLAYELGLLARSIGKKVRFNFQATGKLIKHRTTTVSMSTSPEVIKFVKSPLLAEVFDMEVEEDHSFVAGDIVCHNCFVIDSPKDSYGGILFTDQEEAQIMKRRGGVGFDISTIRPKGMITANAARTTDGIAVFMERFSNTCREVAQGGRRGALMLSISCHHPEIRTFINSKKDLTKVTGANISIRFTDEFMRAVKANEKVELRWPVDSKEPVVSHMVDAKEIWDEFVQAAWQSAEPGCLFWDTAIQNTPSDCYSVFGFGSTSTNPCQPGWATVLTPEGIRTFNDIEVGSTIWSGKRWTKVVNKVCTGVKPVYAYKTRAGVFYGTENHRVVSNGEKVEVRNADSIDISPTPGMKQNSKIRTSKIISRISKGMMTVYDITVEADEHTYWTGGLLVSNCGEIILSPYDSCRLLLVNCMGFVKNPFTDRASFDWKEFHNSCYLAQRLMDDMIDLELEAIDSIREKIEADPEPSHVKQIEWDMWTKISNACKNGRRTGLGLTAVGDAVAAFGLTYGSQQSIELVEKLYKTMETASYTSSVDMAEERGAFPVFSRQLEKESGFINRVIDAANIREKYESFGRRNIANTTTPPAGTTSLLACLSEEERLFGTTSGIEPAYLISYKRRKKINPNDKDAPVHFVDKLGDKWTEFEVKHAGFELWQRMNSGGSNLNPEASPFWKATSADVDWKASVDLQAAAQRWVDHAISKTCNLPNSATPELVNDVYMRAWEEGCKGFTIYRDGSRSGVLVSNVEKESDKLAGFAQHNAPKRPRELPCHIYHSTVNGEKWTIFVGLMDDKPYEIMGGLAKYVKIPKRVTSGKLVKYNGEINPARYDLHYDFEKGPEEETVIQDVGNVFENPTNSGFTRVLSLALRHGAPVQFAVEQLVKAGDKESDLFTITKAFSRVLKNYVKDGTKVTSVKKCKACGSSNMAYKDGCAQCLDCGDSKCG